MKNNVSQLLADFAKAHLSALTETEIANFSFEEEMEFIENYATGRNINPSLSVDCGLSIDQFPPEEKLEDDEIKQIIEAFMQMLSSRYMCIDMPKEVPLRITYPIIVKLLNREAWHFPTGIMHLELCTGYAPECELGEYCQCLKFGKDGKEEI